MAISVAFKTDTPSVDVFALLTEQKHRPYMMLRREDGTLPEDLDTVSFTTKKLVPEKTLLEWMKLFVGEIDFRTSCQSLRYTFVYTDRRSEEDSSVCPAWFVTITDSHERKLHKHWTISFGPHADIVIRRGIVAAENDIPDVSEFEERKQRLAQAIASTLQSFA